MRRLSPEEAALWRRVTGGVRALRVGAELTPGRSSRAKSRDDAALPSVSTSLDTNGSAVRRVAPLPRPSANTLDSTWDKRIATGALAPEVTIDLHGETLSTAHAKLDRGLDAAIRHNVRTVLLITGRPARDNPRLPPTSRGVIRATVGDWLAASPHAGKIAAVRNAHQRHGGHGALYLILKRGR